MVVIGTALILGGILLLVGYGLFELLVAVDLSLWVRLGIGALALGFVLVVLTLLRERLKDAKREADEDDPSNNP